MRKRKGERERERERERVTNTKTYVPYMYLTTHFTLFYSHQPITEWGEFLHRPGKKFFDFEEIRSEIEAETDRGTAGKGAFSEIPISLQIFSPYVVDLTLIDLPGLTKVPIGDQPANVEEVVRNIIVPFIENPLSILVAVTPANLDIANSEALKMAREVDPLGRRTLGVITKIDLMDRGTDCLDVLNGKMLPLKPYGYVGVVNRSQKDIMDKLPIEKAVEQERAYFETHEVYGRVHSRMGTLYLAKTLNRILAEHIERSLPELKNKVASSLIRAYERQKLYGPSPYSSDNERGSALLQILLKFCQNYSDSIDGRLMRRDSTPLIGDNELSGGSSIGLIFRKTYSATLHSTNAFEGLSDEDIRTAILNAAATRPSLFVTEVTFELLVKRQIRRMLQPSLTCADLVYDELRRVATQATNMLPELKRFPNLAGCINDSVRTLLRDHLERTKKMITNLVEIQLAYVKTTHPEFISGSEAIAAATDWRGSDSMGSYEHYDDDEEYGDDEDDSGREREMDRSYIDGDSEESEENASPKGNARHHQMRGNAHAHEVLVHEQQRRQQEQTSSSIVMLEPLPSVLGACDVHHNDRSLRETRIIKSLIASYYSIVRKHIQDAVPKSVMCFLVENSKKNMQTDLLKSLYKENQVNHLMEEDASITKRRERAMRDVEVLTQAQSILASMKELGSKFS